MSRSLNAVQLIGNVGNEPEVRTTGNGNKVATFSLATSRQWNSASGEKQEKTEWHRVVAWNVKGTGLADIIEKYVKKGDKLFVGGSIEYGQYKDKDGNTRYTTEIKAGEILMLGGKDEKPPITDGMKSKARAAVGYDVEDFPAALDDLGADDLPF